MKDIIPEKKMSYNDVYNKKKGDLQLKSDKYGRHIDVSMMENGGMREKKKSGQY